MTQTFRVRHSPSGRPPPAAPTPISSFFRCVSILLQQQRAGGCLFHSCGAKEQWLWRRGPSRRAPRHLRPLPPAPPCRQLKWATATATAPARAMPFLSRCGGALRGVSCRASAGRTPPRRPPPRHRRPRRCAAAPVALSPLSAQFRTAGVNTHLTQYLTPLRVGDYVRLARPRRRRRAASRRAAAATAAALCARRPPPCRSTSRRAAACTRACRTSTTTARRALSTT